MTLRKNARNADSVKFTENTEKVRKFSAVWENPPQSAALIVTVKKANKQNKKKKEDVFHWLVIVWLCNKVPEKLSNVCYKVNDWKKESRVLKKKFINFWILF